MRITLKRKTIWWRTILFAALWTECTGNPCDHFYLSSVRKEGNFSSPGYPSEYPALSNCRYVFQGTPDEQIRINFFEFDLEPGNKAGCLYDYIDIFTIDMEMTKNLEDRICGREIPKPFLSIHHRLEVVFKSDYAGSWKGFYGTYEFMNETELAEWKPFPPSSPGCSSDFQVGYGGVITSPRYPDPYPSDSECTWTIRVESYQRILLKILDIDFGEKANCDLTHVSIYNGFASSSKPPAEKLCERKEEKEHREFMSTRYRVVVRYQSGSNEFSRRGFRMVWTAIWLPKDGPGDQCGADGFHCKGGEYCIDTSSRLCNPLQRLCVARSARCNSLPDCVGNDQSDEERCFTATSLVTMATVAVSVVAVAMATVCILLWHHRKAKQRREREAKIGKQKQRRQHQQQMKTDSAFVLGGFNRSPSLQRSSSSPAPGGRPSQPPDPGGKGHEGVCGGRTSGASVRSQSGPRPAQGDWRPSGSHPALCRRQSDSGGGGGRWRSVVQQLDLLRPVSGPGSIPQCKSINDFRRTVRQVASTTTTAAPPGESSSSHRSLERLLSEPHRGGGRGGGHSVARQSKRQAAGSEHGHQSDDSTRNANRSASSLV